MSSQLGLLKHIPCPAGDQCTAFRCLFRHKGDEETWPLPGDKKNNEQDRKEDHEEDQDPDQAGQEGPRKRVKTGDDEYDPTSPALPIPPTHQQPANPFILKDASKKEDLSTAAAATAKKPISPPPLKRKLVVSPGNSPERTKPATLATTSTKVGTVASASTASKPSTMAAGSPSPAAKKQHTGSSSFSGTKTADANAPSPAQARKPETLNPRHLASSPASHEARYKILKLLHGELVRLNSELKKTAAADEEKLILSEQELIWMALDEEQKFATTKPAIYSNSIKHRIVAYKRMPLIQWKKERLEAWNKELAKRQPKKKEEAVTPEPVVIETGLTPQEEVLLLKKRLLTPVTDLTRFGYVAAVPTEEDMQKAREAEQISKGWEVCDRCSKRFQVFPGRREEDGALASGGKCTHHPGRAYWPPRVFGDASIRRYRCCGQAVGDTPGCTTSDHHVFKVSDPKRLALVWNFAETPPNPNAPVDRAVCFDCEMGYTVKGLELVRLTATSWPGGEELLDVLVQPVGEILDLNSRYSGVYPEDMVNATPFSLASMGKPLPPAEPVKEGERRRLPMVSSPEVARDLLFSLISPDTPLIGHGLENDLNSIRIVHPTLVDTILLYPHPKGLPIRYGLRVLMETQLHRRIQVEAAEGQLAGHDSAEDARAAGDLARLKVMKEWDAMRKGGWELADGEFVPPASSTSMSSTSSSSSSSEGGGDKGKGKELEEGELTEEFIEAGQDPITSSIAY